MEDSELDVPVADNVWARCEASLVPSDEWLEDIVPIIFYEVNLRLIKIPRLDYKDMQFLKNDRNNNRKVKGGDTEVNNNDGNNDIPV